MSASHADMLRDVVRRIDTALNESPADVCITRLFTPAFLKIVPAPLTWVDNLQKFLPAEARTFLDHDPAPDTNGLYIIAEQRIDQYITRYRSPNATPTMLLWDIAVATIWQRVRGTPDLDITPRDELFLTVPTLECVAAEFCTFPEGHLVAAGRLHYQEHMRFYADTYFFFARRWAPHDAVQQRRYVEILCFRDTETKMVSNAASFVHRMCGEDKAIQFLVRTRDVRKDLIGCAN